MVFLERVLVKRALYNTFVALMLLWAGLSKQRFGRRYLSVSPGSWLDASPGWWIDASPCSWEAASRCLWLHAIEHYCRRHAGERTKIGTERELREVCVVDAPVSGVVIGMIKQCVFSFIVRCFSRQTFAICSGFLKCTIVWPSANLLAGQEVAALYRRSLASQFQRLKEHSLSVTRSGTR